MSRRERPGFTLLEVIVAIAVSALIMLAARGLSDRLHDASQRVAEVSRREGARARSDWLVRSLVGQIEVSQDAGETFGGTPTDAVFTSWCRRAAGWEERCRVHLHLEAAESARVLIATTNAAGAFSAIVLDTVSQETEFRYLIDADDGGHWIRSWGEGATVPLAIGLVSARDTTILRVAPRG